MTKLPSPNVDLSTSHMIRKVRRYWFGTPCHQESSVYKRTALIEIELEDGEIIDEVRGPFSKGVAGEYTLHIRLKNKPAQQVNPTNDQSTPIRRDDLQPHRTDVNELANTVNQLIKSHDRLYSELLNLRKN